MNEPAPRSAREVLLELERLLESERAALVKLERDAIEEFATQKLALDAELRELVQRTPLALPEREQLERVRRRAFENQLLLAHARSCVQGVLSLLTPENAPGYTATGHPGSLRRSAGRAGSGPSPSHPSAAPPPLLLNLRR